MTQTEAIERLAKWLVGCEDDCGGASWAREKYLDLLYTNVAALTKEWKWQDGDPGIVSVAMTITHTTIAALELEATDASD